MLLQGLLVTAVTIGIVRSLILTWKTIHMFPESIQWIGLRKERLSRLRVCGREMFAGLRTIQAGYEKVGALVTWSFLLCRC